MPKFKMIIVRELIGKHSFSSMRLPMIQKCMEAYKTTKLRID